MRCTLASLALAALAVANPVPQGVTSAISPAGTAPAGCSPDYSGSFQIQVVKASAKRDLAARQAGELLITLSGGILMDADGRTGYIAANHQFQFDAPAQTGAIYTAGWSVCANSSLAIGPSAMFYQCLSGDFYNLYDESTGAQCSPVYIDVIGSGGAATPAPAPSGGVTIMTDGQPTAGPAVTQITDGQIQAPVCTQIGDGQPQCASAAPVTQISDGQIQAPTGVVTQITDGQIQAPTGVVTQITDGQIQAPACTEIVDGQPQCPTAAPVTQISDGQIQAPTGVVTQITDGQIQAPTGAVTQISDGQIQAPTGVVTQISDGQIQAPTAAPCTQIVDGQPQCPTSAPVANASAPAMPSASIVPATGSASTTLGNGIFALAAGLFAVFML